MNPKKKIILNLGIFGTIFLILLVLVLPYLLGQIQKTSKDLTFLKQKFLTFQKEEENLQQLRMIYQNYESNLRQINQVFVNYEVPVQFIEFLEKTAQISQQEINISLPFAKKEDKDPWPSLTFQISTKGSFPSFLRFLDKIENSPYLIEILNLNVKKITQRGSQEASLGEVEGNLLIKVFTRNGEI